MGDIDLTIRPQAGAPLAEHEQARARGAVHWSDTLNGWVVSSYDDVKKVLSDSANFSNENTPIAQAFAPEAMLVNDTPLHHKIRAVWAKPASVSAVVEKADAIQEIVDSLLAPMGARLRNGETVDLVRVFEAFTGDVITSLMDVSREKSDQFQVWNRVLSDNSVLVLEESDPRYAQREAAKEEIYTLLRAEIARRRPQFEAGEQPDDLVSLMMAAEGRDGITPQIALGNLLNLFTGALDTTVRWLGNCVVTLLSHPDVLAEVKQNRTLLPKAIEEVLRRESVVQLTLRIVKNDMRFHDKDLKAGDFVYALPGAANRDPDVFENPEVFDIYRKPRLQLGFGFGMHQCLGMNIARKEVSIFIERIFDLLPEIEIVECDYGATWSLWGPATLKVRSIAQSETLAAVA